MTPPTLHLIASLVRHGRGMATSVEKWIRQQEPAPAMREGLQVIAVARGVLTSLEGQLAQFDVDLTVTATDAEHRAEVEQPIRSEADRLSSPLSRVK